MKYLLITVAFVALFYPSASAITCYDCSRTSSPCTTQKTCSAEFDSCVFVRTDEHANSHSCWKSSQCEFVNIETHFKTGSFKYRCCSAYLCNSSPLTIAGSMIILSIASFLTTLFII
uniref:CD59 glycoprotein-like n=1 Tax=Euleptes europaea TaxID=460621 RepID=UPI002540D201|nr:CD59 glycoprotein-like [Euleptes europaea]